MTIDEPTLRRPGTPEAELCIDADLVRRLLGEQHPDLLGHELQPAPSGWDNSNWRLGEDLALRLPRRAVGAEAIRREQRWLPEIARRISIPLPEPVRIGRPSQRYPWFWSVVRWIDGEVAADAPLRADQAQAVAGFLRELHVEAPAQAPVNPFRAVPITERREAFEERFARLEAVAAGSRCRELGSLDVGEVRSVWERCHAAPMDAARVWVHGDLHPKNVVTRGGSLAAVIDWGDLTAGDPATDLACMWMLFSPDTHPGLCATYGGCSQATLERARAWALLFGVMLLDTGLANDPTFSKVGLTTLHRACEP